MANQGITIVEKNGVQHLSGVLNEYADFQALLGAPSPLKLNFKNVTRFNSIGIRNLLKFLVTWCVKDKKFEYLECPVELVDQINMIPALLGPKGHGEIKSLLVPYECGNCGYEEDCLDDTQKYVGLAQGGPSPLKKCPKCGSDMAVLTDAYFVFLTR